jgi:putative phosphoribosyl transferase
LLPSGVEDEPQLRDKVEVFKDRIHAGKLLARRLSETITKTDLATVVAIPSGGLPIGCAIATELRIPLDVILVRKIPIPWEPEAGFGSVTFDGSTFLNEALLRILRLSKDEVNRSIEKAKKGLEERTRKFLAVMKEGLLTKVSGRVAILVDDGLASGYTMLASVESIKKRKPKKIIIAVPTGSISAIHLVSMRVDKLLCLNVRSEHNFAVADAYQKWYDVPEGEALDLIKKLKGSG